jgi:hypothetical protein
MLGIRKRRMIMIKDKYTTFLKDYIGFAVDKNQIGNAEDLIGTLNETLEKDFNCQICYDLDDNKFYGFQINPIENEENEDE